MVSEKVPVNLKSITLEKKVPVNLRKSANEHIFRYFCYFCHRSPPARHIVAANKKKVSEPREM